MLCVTHITVGEMGMATAPVVGLATWALFGIQEIGLLIEDPFQVCCVDRGVSVRTQIISATTHAHVRDNDWACLGVRHRFGVWLSLSGLSEVTGALQETREF